MKKKHKVYAIPGMMEYQTRVFVGRNAVKLSFAGGSINNGCARPARFQTSDLIIQNAIEASSDFRRGLIRLERVIELKEEIPVERPIMECPLMEGSHSEGRAVGAIAQASPQSEAGLSPGEKGQREAVAAAGYAEDSPAEEDLTLKTEDSSLEIVEVSCKDVAKAYLQDHFGENPAPLRTRDDVQKCAAKHGITFNFV